MISKPVRLVQNLIRITGAECLPKEIVSAGKWTDQVTLELVAQQPRGASPRDEDKFTLLLYLQE